MASPVMERILKRRYWPLSGLPLVNTTMDATVNAPWMVEMSKHSMRSGGAGSASALSKLQEGLVGAVVGVAGAHHVAHEHVPGVALGHLHEAVLLAALRAMQARDAPALAGEPLPDHLGIRQIDGEIDLGGDVGGLVVVALDEPPRRAPPRPRRAPCPG